MRSEERMDMIRSAAAPVSRMSTTDALKRLAARRDPDAWAAIVEQHGVRILNMAQRITGDRALCDDVCQETLLQIREHAGHFSPPAPPQDAEASARGWIMRIASCTAFRVLRVRERSERREFVVASAAQNMAPSAAEIAAAREQFEQVRREVAQLPESLREPLSLRFFGALEYAELSMALGCSEDAAKKRVQRGLAQLRTRLAACGIALSLGALMSALGSGSVSAAEIGAAGVAGNAGLNAAAGNSTSQFANQAATQILDPQRLAAWQGLLHSTHAPALSGVVILGGLTVMAKQILGAAAVILFALVGVGAMQIHSLQNENAEAKAQAAKMAENMSAMEKKLNERANDAGLLHDKLAAREAQLEKLREQVAELDKKTAATGRGVAFTDVPGDVTFHRFIAPPPGAEGQPNAVWTANGVTTTAAGGKPGDPNTMKRATMMVNGQKIEIPLPNAANPGQPIQIQLQDDLKDLDAQVNAKVQEMLKKNVPGQPQVREFNTPNGNVQVRVLNGGAGIEVHAEQNEAKPVKPPAPEPVPNF